MRKPINNETIYGRLYDMSQLSLKKVQNPSSEYYNTDFISGSIDLATDEDCLNIVSVRFTFLQPTYKSGKENTTFTFLKKMLENGKTVLEDGKDNATKLKVTGSLGLNDFYSSRDDGEDVLISAKVNSGSFVSPVKVLPEEDERSTFECDVLINGIKKVEASEESGVKEDYLIIKGAVFDFRKAILPVEFICRNPGGIEFFETLNPNSKNLIFTKIWGDINSETKKEKKVFESAFGQPSVKEYSKVVKEWLITGTSREEAMYQIGDEQQGITEEEIEKALADREVYLADVKKRAEEYQASKNNVSATAPAQMGGFNF